MALSTSSTPIASRSPGDTDMGLARRHRELSGDAQDACAIVQPPRPGITRSCVVGRSVMSIVGGLQEYCGSNRATIACRVCRSRTRKGTLLASVLRSTNCDRQKPSRFPGSGFARSASGTRWTTPESELTGSAAARSASARVCMTKTEDVGRSTVVRPDLAIME